MTDLESRLTSTLRTAADAHVESVRSDTPRLRAGVVQRTRRRKAARGTFMVLAAAAVVAAAIWAWPGSALRDDAQLDPVAPDPGRAVTEYIALPGFNRSEIF